MAISPALRAAWQSAQHNHPTSARRAAAPRGTCPRCDALRVAVAAVLDATSAAHTLPAGRALLVDAGQVTA